MKTYNYVVVCIGDFIDAIMLRIGQEADDDLHINLPNHWSFGDAVDTLVEPDDVAARLLEYVDSVTEAEFQAAVEAVYNMLPDDFYVALGS